MKEREGLAEVEQVTAITTRKQPEEAPGNDEQLEEASGNGEHVDQVREDYEQNIPENPGDVMGRGLHRSKRQLSDYWT